MGLDLIRYNSSACSALNASIHFTSTFGKYVCVCATFGLVYESWQMRAPVTIVIVVVVVGGNRGHSDDQSEWQAAVREAIRKRLQYASTTHTQSHHMNALDEHNICRTRARSNNVHAAC